jgi:pimeloyl-ACP methyl ester carboxylesterase
MGKSLGTASASVAADRALPAVWFTPLLTEPRVAAALRRATAPVLLIGGTDDDWWDGDGARAVTSHVIEVEGAGHSMFVPGPLKESAAVLGEASTAVERFLDEVVWPA